MVVFNVVVGTVDWVPFDVAVIMGEVVAGEEPEDIVSQDIS